MKKRPFRHLLSAAFVTIFSAAAQGNSVNIATNVSCSTDLGNVSGSSSCEFAGTHNNVDATASASYSISGNTLTFASSVYAYVSENLGGLSLGSAFSTTSLTVDFTTSGLVRDGLVVPILLTAGGSAQDALGTGMFSVAGLGGTCNGIRGCVLPNQIQPHPVVLGTSLELIESSLAAASGPNNMASIGALGLSYSFEFFEADGVTPVNISLASPEPGTFSFIAFGLCLSVCLRKRTTGLD